MKSLKTNFSCWRKIKVFFYYPLLKANLQKRIFALLIGILLWHSLEITKDHPKEVWKSKSDFEDYYIASIRLKNLQDPYFIDKINDFLGLSEQIKTLEDLKSIFERSKGVGSYLYLPLFSFFLIPLTIFEYKTAALIYEFFQIGLLIVSFYIFFLL